MSQRSEHGGGEASINREAAEALAYEIEKAERMLRSAMAQTAMHEIDRIIQEENKRCPVIEEDEMIIAKRVVEEILAAERLAKLEEAEDFLPPIYD